MRLVARARPRATLVPRQRLHGPSDRVNATGQLDSADRYGGALNVTTPPFLFQYHWDDVEQINPASEQPKLIFNSGAQPIIRWGHRRFVRTFMGSPGRFLGRWFYIGQQGDLTYTRGRMTGVPIRLGTSYTYPRFQTGPRSIPLGQR